MGIRASRAALLISAAIATWPAVAAAQETAAQQTGAQQTGAQQTGAQQTEAQQTAAGGQATRQPDAVSQAATQSVEPPASATDTGAGDIIVTAQKRSQSIRDVGMSITAVSDEALRTQNVRDVGGLTKIDPSFAVSESNYGAPIYTIRGIGFNDFSLAATPTVSVYTDEVPYAYPSLTKAATMDLERVEILKGPQGTLFGQNATGGAVNYIAAKPTSTPSAGIEATYGSFNAVNLNSFLSGPLTETLSYRIATDIDRGGAYQHSLTRDDTLGVRDSVKLRGLLRWDPTSRLTVNLNINGFRDRSENRVPQVMAVIPQNPTYYTAATLPNLFFTRPAPKDNQVADWFEGTHPRLDEKYVQASLRTDYDITDAFTLTYLGSYQNYVQHDVSEPAGGDLEQIIIQNGRITSNFQEARVSGKLLDDRLNVLLGVNYADNRVTENQVQNINGVTSAYGYASLFLAFRQPIQKLTATNNFGHTRSVGKAVYGNVDFSPTNRFTLHLGGRYTQTDIDNESCSKDFNGSSIAGNALLQQRIFGAAGVIPIRQGECGTLGVNLRPQLIVQSLDQHNFSWRAGVDFKPVAGTLLYANVSQGYKSGSFPTIAASIYTSLRPVTQESLRAYEAGVKSRVSRVIDVDASLFYYDYRDKQIAGRLKDPLGLFGVLNLLVNIPKSREYGAELNLRLRPIEGLTITGQGTYLNSKVLSDTPGFDGYGVPTNYKDSAFPDAPKWSFLGDAAYKWTVANGLAPYVGANVRYRSRAFSQIATDTYNDGRFVSPSTEIAPYALLGLRAGIEAADGSWRFQVFGNNVTDKFYITHAQKLGDTVVRYTGAPATIGASFQIRY